MANTPDNGLALCYAESDGNRWPAYCLTFDLAVEAASLEEARSKLAQHIVIYLETLDDLPAADRSRLLRRRAPLHAFATFLYRMLRSIMTAGGSMRSDYTEPFQLSGRCSAHA